MISTHTLLVVLGCGALACLSACEKKQVEPEPLPVAAAEPEPDPLTVDAATLPGMAVTAAPSEVAPGILAWDTGTGSTTPLDPAGSTWLISAWSGDGTQWFGDADGPDELVLPGTDAGAFTGWGDAVQGMTVGDARKIYMDPTFMETESMSWPVPGDGTMPIVMDIALVSADGIAVPNTLPGMSVDGVARQGSATGLRWYDITTGTGTGLNEGDAATVTITAWLPDGTKVWSTDDAQQITINDSLMPGLQEGLLGMTTGATRKLVIPPSLGTGFDVDGAIPAGTTLVVDVTRSA